MRALLLLVALLATTVHGFKPGSPLVYDVTTIYRLSESKLHKLPFFTIHDRNKGVNISGPLDLSGSVEVHARTNARGLPFLLQDGTIRGPEVGISLPECSRSTTNCGWKATNFTDRKASPHKKPPLNLDTYKQFEYVLSASKYTEPRPYSSLLKFNFKTTRGESYCNGHCYLAVFLISNVRGRSVQDADMYYLRIRHEDEGPSYLVKCTSNNYDGNYYMPGDRTRQCEKYSEKNLDSDINFTLGALLTFSVEVVNGRIVVEVSQGDKKQILFDWTDPYNRLSISDVVLATSILEGIMTSLEGPQTVMELSEETGTMSSPPLSPGLDEVCLSIVYFAESEATIEVQLKRDETTSTVATLTPEQSGGWSHQNVIVYIPKDSTSETIVVLKATKEPGSTLIIQRVGGCNAEDPEDVLVLSDSEETLLTVQSPGVDIAHGITYAITEKNTCKNGGIKVEPSNDVRNQPAGCICPAGFTGENCEDACGANSYGADCEGVCSETDRGCKAMILCRPILGCACAPGFKGIHCNRACDGDEYGAGCRQSCGKCIGGTCDAYSGVCHEGCEQGHFPPLCQQTYTHVSLAPRVVVQSFYNVSVSANLYQLDGEGDPQFYQLQYTVSTAERNVEEWQEQVPQSMPKKTSDRQVKTEISVGNITGLKPGTSYQLRVVVIDRSGAIYQGEHVPTTNFTMPCTVPGKAEYNQYTNKLEFLDFDEITDRYFKIIWKIPTDKAPWCPVIGYEVHVKMGWQWKKHNQTVDKSEMKVYNLLPGRKYVVKVRAITTKGAAAFSRPRVVTTLERAPDHVINLKEKEITATSLIVNWSPPKHPAGTIRRYHVTYECLGMLACVEEDCNDSTGELEVMTNSVLLDGLLPYARYRISVAGFSGSLGPSTALITATSQSSPEVAPLPANPGVISRNNSSLTVQWAPPISCRLLQGYRTGYHYELLSPGQQQPLTVGSTTNCSATLDNLKPYSDYIVRVYVDNSAGWSKAHPLEILAKTRATTPEPVENLTVYKRGRRMIGLRWSPPRMTYGTLQSFTITHRPLVGSHKAVSETIKPSPCTAWPSLYCHTVGKLQSDTEYKLAVEPRNSEVAEDGDEATVTATTKEGAPGAPSFLRVKNHTNVSLTVEWGLPDLINGHLRSFLVNIEETDSINTTDCCQYFPIREVVVTSEDSGYDFQMTGLKPASSYEVSVSAKTVAMGPAVTLTVHTRPSTPVLTQPPTMAELNVTGSTLLVQVEPASGYQDELVSRYLLLLEDYDHGFTPYPLTNRWLLNELHQYRSLTLVAEFTQSEMSSGRKLELQMGSPMIDGLYGPMGLPTLTPGTQYRWVWALVLDYCGAQSVGQIPGHLFTLA